MELHAVKVTVMNSRSVANAIVATRNGIAAVLGIIAMHVVNVFTIMDSGEKRRAEVVELVPAHLWYFQALLLKLFNAYGNDVQTGGIVLFGMRAEQLHAHTNTQHR